MPRHTNELLNILDWKQLPGLIMWHTRR